MMKTDLLIEYISSIRRNKTRFALEGLAVASGVIILLISISGFNIFRNGSFGKISRITFESVSFYTNPTTKSYHGFNCGRIWKLESSDIDALKKEFAGVIIDTGPVYCFSEGKQVLPNNDMRDNAIVTATHPGVFNSISVSLVSGRFINEMDMKQKRKVCVIGKSLSEKWYGKKTDPCGKYILVEGVSYRIVGVLTKENKMANPFGDEANAILIPYSTADAVYGLNGQLSHLVFSLKATSEYQQTKEKIICYLLTRHNVSPEDKGAYNTICMQDYAQMLSTIFDGIDILFWVVFSGLILSGLLGVFGITLLSVKERKSEIGIRLAMGATPEEIEKQFICESLTIVLFSSFSGLMISEIILAAARAANKTGLISDPLFGMPQLSFVGVLMIILLITAGGVCSGYFPARNMIKKQVSELFDDAV